MNNESLHTFKPSKPGGLWSVLVLIFVLGMAPLSLTSPSDGVLRARGRAEVLAYQVAQLYRENVQSSTGPESSSMGPAYVRLPSSAAGMPAPAQGVMGRDPWGRPFRYEVREQADSQIEVRMVSAGPDGIFEQVADSGDDIQLTLSF